MHVEWPASILLVFTLASYIVFPQRVYFAAYMRDANGKIRETMQNKLAELVNESGSANVTAIMQIRRTSITLVLKWIFCNRPNVACALHYC